MINNNKIEKFKTLGILFTLLKISFFNIKKGNK